MLKKLLCVSAGVLAMTMACATAQDAGAPPAKPKHERKADAAPKPEMKELTVTGTLAKQESKNKKGEAVVSYVLTTEDGATVKLPTPRKSGKDAAGAVDLEQYVGVKVKVSGMGYEKEGKGGKKSIALSKINNVEKVADAAPAAAPAK